MYYICYLQSAKGFHQQNEQDNKWIRMDELKRDRNRVNTKIKRTRMMFKTNWKMPAKLLKLTLENNDEINIQVKFI